MGLRNRQAVMAIPAPQLGVIGMASFGFNGTTISNRFLAGCIASLSVLSGNEIGVTLYPPQIGYSFTVLVNYVSNASFAAWEDTTFSPTFFRFQGVGVNPVAGIAPPIILVTVFGPIKN